MHKTPGWPTRQPGVFYATILAVYDVIFALSVFFTHFRKLYGFRFWF